MVERSILASPVNLPLILIFFRPSIRKKNKIKNDYLYLYLVWKKLWRLQSNNLILIITSFIASSVERVLGKATIPIRYSVWLHSCTEYQQFFEKSLVSRWRRIDFI